MYPSQIVLRYRWMCRFLAFIVGVATSPVATHRLRQMHDTLLLEPGEVFFHGPNRPKNFFRLGFSSIPEQRIPDGVAELARRIRAS